MKLFGSEGAAQAYLEKRIPEKEREKKHDLATLKERLFDVPEAIQPGHHEFEGQGGLRVSFDLEKGDHHLDFERCWEIYGRRLDDSSGKRPIQGDIRPIFLIKNLRMETEHFRYDQSAHTRNVSITWLPDLRMTNSELSASFASIDRGDIYLAGKDTIFSSPLALLTYFHEVGHIETRSPDALLRERNSVLRRYSSAGFETEPMKAAALELQRERDANAWMLRTTRGMFDDLDVSRDELTNYVNHSQLRSYHEAFRPLLSEATDQI